MDDDAAPVQLPVQLLTAHAPGTSGELAGAAVRHGEHPRDAASRAAGRPVPAGVLPEVRSVPDSVPGRHLLQLVYGPPPAGPAVALPFIRSDSTSGADPPRVRRCGAYAVLLAGGRLLLTRLAGGQRLWTLPGGGIDPGEHPTGAVRREVLEETGLPLLLGPLIDVDSQHYTGHAPDGRLEDFHAIRFVYAGGVPTDVEPRVLETAGSTDLVAWVPVAELDRLRLAPLVPRALRVHGST